MSGWSVFTGLNPFDDWAKVVDCGDAPLTLLDNTVALKQLDLAHKVRIDKTCGMFARGSDKVCVR